jgi:hypothetical protein
MVATGALLRSFLYGIVDIAEQQQQQQQQQLTSDHMLTSTGTYLSVLAHGSALVYLSSRLLLPASCAQLTAFY